MTGSPPPEPKKIEGAVPPDNLLRSHAGGDASFRAAVWIKDRKRWEIYACIDAREIVGGGAGSWVDDDGNPPPQS